MEWSDTKISQWASEQKTVRDYAVIRERIQNLSGKFEVIKYGELSHDPERYPLFFVKTNDWMEDKPSILISSGIHGYEPSGINASLEFLEDNAQVSDYNLLVFPCIAPWGYEKDHRWDMNAEDPNRGFLRTPIRRAVEECQAVIKALDKLELTFDVAIDLHETPDRDKELRRLRADRFGTPLVDNPDQIPDGFYLVLEMDDKDSIGHDYGKKIVEAVSKVTQISPDDFVMNLPNHTGIVFMDIDGLFGSFLRKNDFAPLSATTEAYPDPLPKGEAEKAQIAAINAAIEFAIAG